MASRHSSVAETRAPGYRLYRQRASLHRRCSSEGRNGGREGLRARSPFTIAIKLSAQKTAISCPRRAEEVAVRLSNPLVSIVICCHNRRDYLQQTLDSVFAQTYSPVEIIVMDADPPTGRASHGQLRRPDLYTWQDQRQGIAAARTNASRIARGEFIAYQDDYDLMPADRITNPLQRAVRIPHRGPSPQATTPMIDKVGNLTGSRWMPGTLEDKGRPVLIEDGQAAVLWPKVPAVPHTTLFRRRLGEQIGWFDLDFKYACSDAGLSGTAGPARPDRVPERNRLLLSAGHTAIWSDDVRSSCTAQTVGEASRLNLVPASRSCDVAYRNGCGVSSSNARRLTTA